jgi:glutathione peroxidase
LVKNQARIIHSDGSITKIFLNKSPSDKLSLLKFVVNKKVKMKIYLFILSFSAIVMTNCTSKNQSKSIKIEKMEVPSESTNTSTNFYSLDLKDINGKKLDLTTFKGKKLMIVNVASECGYTPQYEALQKVFAKYQSTFNILACPSNDFGGQEPGTSEEIVTFCKKNYGVTFPLSEKVKIKDNPHPLYQWLTLKTNNGVLDANVKWNFTKFLIDEKGNLVKSLPSSVTPEDTQIISWLESK